MTPQPTVPPPAPSSPAKKTTSTVLIVIAVLLGGCCVFGILAAIAIPNFIKFQSRSKQSEGRVTVRSIYTAQKSVFSEQSKYSTDIKELALGSDGNRYTCFLSTHDAMPPRLGSQITYGELKVPGDSEPGVRGVCPDCQFVALCAGNIDTDATIDVWSIASFERVCAGVTTPAGQPCNDLSDVEN